MAQRPFAGFADNGQASPAAPAKLPGNGLAQHDFLYAGEQKQQRMFIVRGGHVVWTYTSEAKGEISDAILMSTGNIVFAHQFGVTVIRPDKSVIWNYDAPAGSEIHTAQPIGVKHVLFIQNGSPAMLKVVNIESGVTEREFALPVGNPASVHGQFRHARITDAGTILIAHMDMKKVAEYDSTGKQVWAITADSPWSAERLTNGNTLIATNKKDVREVNSRGEIVWEWQPEDAPQYRLSSFQIATRLSNGNTLINNWINVWNAKVDESNPEIQALEVTAQKKIVWALRSWADPVALGPATTIQLLDENRAPEKVRFGDIQ